MSDREPDRVATPDRPARGAHGGETKGEKGGLSRRGVLTGAGLAVAGGVGLAAAGPVTGALAADDAVGTGPQGSTVVEFRGRIVQSGSAGETFTSYGYLTKANGATDADLFTGSTKNETTALFTAFASGELVARILDQSVHDLDIVGELTVYQRSHPGATFSNPDSFKVGSPVARFALTLQDVLAVFATGKGIPTLTGDMRQSEAHRLSAGLSGRRFGRVGERLRMFATGLGTLTDPVTLNAFLEIAGNWSAE